MRKGRISQRSPDRSPTLLHDAELYYMHNFVLCNLAVFLYFAIETINLTWLFSYMIASRIVQSPNNAKKAK